MGRACLTLLLALRWLLRGGLDYGLGLDVIVDGADAWLDRQLAAPPKQVWWGVSPGGFGGGYRPVRKIDPRKIVPPQGSSAIFAQQLPKLRPAPTRPDEWHD